MEALWNELLNQASHFALRFFAGLVIFLVFWLAGYLAQTTIRRVYEKSDPGKKDVLNLVGQTTKAGLLVLGAVTALGTMGINVSALVAGLGLTGFALGFALRDALSNLLAGLLIFTYRPFQRYNRIAVAGFEGAVIEIDFRYTTLQADGRKFLIPNGTLFTNTISLLEAEKEEGKA